MITTNNPQAIYDYIVNNSFGDGQHISTREGVVNENEWPNHYPPLTQALVDLAEADNQTKHDATLAKEARDDALNALSYDFGDGRIMQARPEDESNIRNAIEILTTNGISSIDWIMKDNVKHPVSVSDLQIALYTSQRAALDIWNDYNP